MFCNVISVDSGVFGGVVLGGFGFCVFLCFLICYNGGVCVKFDCCFCFLDFVGKFC